MGKFPTIYNYSYSITLIRSYELIKDKFRSGTKINVYKSGMLIGSKIGTVLKNIMKIITLTDKKFI